MGKVLTACFLYHLSRFLYSSYLLIFDTPPFLDYMQTKEKHSSKGVLGSLLISIAISVGNFCIVCNTLSIVRSKSSICFNLIQGVRNVIQ